MVKTGMKPGRNDPCPCGSGKKFKHCCEGKVASRAVSTTVPPQAETNHLIALFNAGRYAEVESRAQMLLERFPDSGTGWKILGAALQLQGKDALPALQKATELSPGNAEAHYNLAVAKKKAGLLHDAVASYQRALKINPGYAEAYNSMGTAFKDMGQIDSALKSYRRALQLKPDMFESFNSLLFTLNYTSSQNPADRVEVARNFGREVARKVGTSFSTWCCAPQPERLRVGMVSGDLYNHPVGYFLEGLLHHLDTKRIELVAYSSTPKSDALTTRIRPHFSAWKQITGKSDEVVAHLIHADGVHVLLDLSGHTGNNRLPVFAWKPAPVQVSWLGYFATTGVAEMDYFLADETGVPEAQRAHFTETVWYLPDTRLCFSPPEIDLPVAPLPALANGYLTFGCFQNLPKIGNAVLDVWSTILTALPEARLRLQCKQLSDPAVVAQLTALLRQQGIDPERVAFHGFAPRGVYLAAHAEVDMLLDTFPYPGGTTTCEALWMGVPTLTLAGDTLLSRQGASLLGAAGLEDWIALNKSEYIEKAVALAGDLPRLALLRSTLRDKVRVSPLFDAARFARNFEEALWGMWRAREYQEPLA